MKKKWTPAARAAFARKMKAARLAKRGGRTKNPKRRRRRVKSARVHRRRRKNARRSGLRFLIQTSVRGNWETRGATGTARVAKFLARELAKRFPGSPWRVVRE